MDEMFHIQVNRGSHIFVMREKHFIFFLNLPLTTGVDVGQKWICLDR